MSGGRQLHSCCICALGVCGQRRGPCKRDAGVHPAGPIVAPLRVRHPQKQRCATAGSPLLCHRPAFVAQVVPCLASKHGTPGAWVLALLTNVALLSTAAGAWAAPLMEVLLLELPPGAEN